MLFDKKNRHLIIYLLVLFIFISCKKTYIIPATKDAAVFSNFPHANCNGKREVAPGIGYGVLRYHELKPITYPVAFLQSGNPYSFKDAFLIGGFDLSQIPGKIKSAHLKLYVHYVSDHRERIMVFVRPLLKKWDDNQVTYLDVYQSKETGEINKNFAQSNEQLCKLVYFNLKATKK
ncbi:MAG: hypothetical protein MJB14_01525, partial [Spirochaetes bacterium]|nr:hypothetical protein [Spirochaetota bacterium]